MDFFIIFSDSVSPILIILGGAFIYNRLVYPDINDVARLSASFFIPVMIFETLTKFNVQFSDLVKPALFMFMYTATLLTLSYIIGKILKLGKDNRLYLMLTVSMINIGNFGLPLIYFTYGEAAISHSILYYIVFNIPLSTLAIYVLSDKSTLKGFLVDIVKIPMFIIILISLLFTSFLVEIPEALSRSLHLISMAAIPLLIFVMGLQLSNIRFDFKLIPVIGLATLLRLCISPFIAWFFLDILDVGIIEKKIALVQTSSPSAMLPLIYAIIFKRPTALLAAIIFSTTIFSSITIPLIIMILKGEL